MSQAQSVSDLLRRIEDETLDGDIVKALLLCQKLGGHAGSDLLRLWAQKELNGWPTGEELPDYRNRKGAMIGVGSVPGALAEMDMVIPTDVLPRELRDAGILDVPVRESISSLQAHAGKDHVRFMPSNSARLAALVNESNTGSFVVGQVHLSCPGSTYAGIITAVRSKVIDLVSELGRSLPAAVTIDDKRLESAVTSVAERLVVVGDHTTIAVGNKSKMIGDNRRWKSGRRGVAAITTGAVAIIGAVVELLRRGSIWPF